MSTDHLRQMKRRLGMTPPSSISGLESAVEKVEMLEKTLNSFRTEVDMKLKVVQQILTTRNEQVTVQKKLLDREQTLYNALLSHWLNTADLAASGVSMNFSADLTEPLDTGDIDFDFSADRFDPGTSPAGGTSSSEPATKKPRRRHRKVSKVNNTEPYGGTETTERLEDGDHVNHSEHKIDDDDGDDDEEWVPSGNVETIQGDHGNGSEQDEDGEDDVGSGNKQIRTSRSKPGEKSGTRTTGRKKGPIWSHYHDDPAQPKGSRKLLCNYCEHPVSGEARRMLLHYNKCKSRQKNEYDRRLLKVEIEVPEYVPKQNLRPLSQLF